MQFNNHHHAIRTARISACVNVLVPDAIQWFSTKNIGCGAVIFNTVETLPIDVKPPVLGACGWTPLVKSKTPVSDEIDILQ